MSKQNKNNLKVCIMNHELIQKLVIAILTFCGTWLTFSLKSKKQKQDNFEYLVEELKTLLRDAKNEIAELDERIRILETDGKEKDLLITSLRFNLMLYESSVRDNSVPHWHKYKSG